VSYFLSNGWLKISLQDKGWENILIHETSVGHSFKNLDWEVSSLGGDDVHNLMPVTFNSSGDSVKTVSCSSDLESWNGVDHLGVSSFIVVHSVISKKTTSHEDLTRELGWVL